MRNTTIPIPELGVLAATRAMAGAGGALLLAGNMDDAKRKKAGWALMTLGALATIPLAIDIIKRARHEPEPTRQRFQRKDARHRAQMR